MYIQDRVRENNIARRIGCCSTTTTPPQKKKFSRKGKMELSPFWLILPFSYSIQEVLHQHLTAKKYVCSVCISKYLKFFKKCPRFKYCKKSQNFQPFQTGNLSGPKNVAEIIQGEKKSRFSAGVLVNCGIHSF